MKRRTFIKKTGTGLAALTSPALFSACKDNAKRPNIILIMADDFGYECLSSNGSTTYSTPHIDALATEGVRFTNCFSTPLCTPSRVQLMTGKYNFRNYTEFGTLDPAETTFGHLFQNAGYKTAVAGKWQLIGHYEGSGYRGKGTIPEKAGFDEYCLWQLDRFGSRYWEPLLMQNGNEIQGKEDDYGPDLVCDFILDFITRHQQEPFFMYYPMILSHDPFVPTPHSKHEKSQRFKNDPQFFADMVAYTDDIVGRITEHVTQLGLRENTLILFIGDNGTHRRITSEMDGKKVKGAKGTTLDTGIHVPMVANWTSIAAKNFVCDDLIDFSDFLPTLLQTAGISAPIDFFMDGYSFLPQIEGKKGKPRDWIFCHYDPKWGRWKKSRFVRTKRYKLYEDGRLYDLEADPMEERPILNGQDYDKPDLRARLSVVFEKMN